MNEKLLEYIDILNSPRIKLLHYTPLEICCKSIRTCYDSHDRSDNMGEEDRTLIYKVGNVYKHASVLEHLVYTFNIQGISRAALQKLTRHRMASFSVQSTQYTLKRLAKHELIPLEVSEVSLEMLSKYVYIMNEYEDILNQIKSINHLILQLKNNTVNQVKYIIPESFKTTLVMTINARSLQNLLKLRTGRSAMFPEIRAIAYTLYILLPEDHEYLFEYYIQNSEDCKELTGIEL